MVAEARRRGLKLTGPHGLLKLSTKNLLKAALNEELTEHLGHAKTVPNPTGLHECAEWVMVEDGDRTGPGKCHRCACQRRRRVPPWDAQNDVFAPSHPLFRTATAPGPDARPAAEGDRASADL
jgi:hypothetical protein